ncbi:MAG TPA: AAA family ATPase, partial [Chthoniobacterales bacterium]
TLGSILSRCIKTGTFCSYQIDPDFPVAWEFGATSSETTPPPPSNGEPVRAGDYNAPDVPAVLGVHRFSLADRTAFVGRETERDAIHAAIDRALRGRGSLLMIGGGPGVGKTRLAMEMAEYAYSLNGFRVLVGHCYERDEPFPYLPFVEIFEGGLAQAASLDDFRRQMGDNAAQLAQLVPSLRRVFPDIPEPLDLPPPQRRRYVFQGVSDALARWARICPHLLLLDDLQWADESTLALLIHLANRLAQFPLVMIGTYRDDYSEANPALVRSLEELIRLGIRPMKLNGLSKNGVAKMLLELSQRQAPENLLGAIFEESQGNPFFVEEVYRHLIEEGRVFDTAGQFRSDIQIDEIDVPENVRLIIGRRLERFNEDEKRVLAAAAVIGRSFSFHLLSAISQTDVDELFSVFEKAQQMGIIVPSSEGPEKPFTFAHELVRQTLAAGISGARRQRLHAAAAGAIEQLYPRAAREYAGEIADHLLKAGSFVDRQVLARWQMQAGKRALEAAAFEEARAKFESALSLRGTMDERERAIGLANLAMAERGLERWDSAITHLREALEIHIGLNDRATIGGSFTELTETLLWAGRFQDAIKLARRGLEYFHQDASVDTVRLLAALGHAYATTGSYEPAREALREASDIAARLSDPKLQARVIGVRSIANFHFFFLRESAEDGLLCEQRAGSEAPPWQRALQLRILHQALLYLGRLQEAAGIAAVLEPLARKIGQSYTLDLCQSAQAMVEFNKVPDLAQLETGFGWALKSEAKVQFAFREALSEVQLGLLDFFRGDWASALRHAQASSGGAMRFPGVVGPEFRNSIDGFGAGMAFRQTAYMGDRAGASAILDESRHLLQVSGQPNMRGSWLLLALAVEGLVMLGEQEQAAGLYQMTHELLATGAVALWPVSRLTHTIAALAACAAHQYEAAEEHFQISMRQAESFPHLLEQTEIRRFRAMMLIERAAPGDREEAQELLRQALASYTRIGMPRHLEIVRALLD